MRILTFGRDKRVDECAARLRGAELSLPSVMLLPIPVTRDGKHVSGTDISLSELLSKMERGMLVVGYGIPQKLYEGEAGGFVDVLHDEKFLLENARLTALGALGYLLSTTERAPMDLSFGVVGYGRIGRLLVQYLLFLGARVTVYSSKKATRLLLGELGIECRPANYGERAGELSDIDILINTAPAALVCGDDLLKNPRLRIIELASGENFPPEAAPERLMALPARMYPESAGRAYYDSVMRMIGGAV